MFLAPIYNISTGIDEMTAANVLEQIQYIMVGLLYILILTVLVVKKNLIISNYKFIQIDFIQWSHKRGANPNTSYEKCVQFVYTLAIPCAIIIILVYGGPFVAAINDLGVLPLDDQSHFVLFWPKVSHHLSSASNSDSIDILYCLNFTLWQFWFTSEMVKHNS